MKNILIAVVAVLVFNAIFVYSGGLELLVKTEQKEEIPERVGTDVIDVFRFTLEEEVQKKIGTPVEGYEPQMFLQVFPGLVETDFDGVEASIGRYAVTEGRLTYMPDDTKLIHSAATAIRRDGYETLLNNIADRIEINLTSDGTITDVMSALVGLER
tara:strand:- start:1291 stop:1761 length:471 start_codon:yes stop_codon:yes gene_type:complete